MTTTGSTLYRPLGWKGSKGTTKLAGSNNWNLVLVIENFKWPNTEDAKCPVGLAMRLAQCFDYRGPMVAAQAGSNELEGRL